MKEIMQTWHLKKGHDHRFNTGHPWIYSNELTESPKGITAGDIIELRDFKDNFLAYGYGHPVSLIALRLLTRDKLNKEPLATKAVFEKLKSAHAWRRNLGLTRYSYRLCFGEADNLPGLIIDRYRTKSQQIFVVELHTAGMDCAAESITAALTEFTNFTHDTFDEPGTKETAVIIKNDIHHRLLEGLDMASAKIIKKTSADLADVEILVAAASDAKSPLNFHVNLIDGQKTGFFLDQAQNVRLLCDLIKHKTWDIKQPVRVLDLFCYAGSWAAQVSSVLDKMGVPFEVTLADASQAALEFAAKNVTHAGCKSIDAVKMDIIKDLDKLPERHYDIVICDPPALIKKRKDQPQGEHGYVKLNTLALKRVKPYGLFASSSCSALLDQTTFTQLINKASQRAEAALLQVACGSLAADHPVLLAFPEANYLKAVFCVVM